MGQAQSGQNAFPGQGQQGEKKDQVGCSSDAQAVQAYCAAMQLVITRNRIACCTLKRRALARVLEVLRCLVVRLLCVPTEGEEEMGATAASTARWQEAAPLRPGNARLPSLRCCMCAVVPAPTGSGLLPWTSPPD